MGCGASKSDGGARNDDPPIDTVKIPDIDTRGPPPEPPDNLKDDIFQYQDYTAIDTKAKQMARTPLTSYETLAKAITSTCTTDLQKARAIFVWLFYQDIYGSWYSGVTDPDTPRGYMKLVKAMHGSFASFYAILCREVGIPCNVIRGVAKGDKYDVGQQDIKDLEGAWCAAYLEKSWRLVHPLWAYFNEKQTYEDGAPPSPGTKRGIINEFFWLTDPTKMICFCKAKTDTWQLLKSKWDQKKFLASPQFTEEYFTSGLMLPKKYNATINADNGLCIIDFDHKAYDEPSLEADVDFVQSISSDALPSGTHMKDYIAITSSSSTRRTAIIRCPVKGRYNVDMHGGRGTGPSKTLPKIVEFRLECSDASQNPQAFPINPKEGFGILPISSQFGISEFDPESGLVLVKSGQQRSFSLMSTQKLDVEGTLTHNMCNIRDLEDFVTTRSTEDRAFVDIVVPDEQHLEFGLNISARPYNSNRAFTTVANYLLVDENWKKKTAVVSPNRGITGSDQERIRTALVTATRKNDIDRLEKAIEDFEHHGLHDNGDLTRARHKLIEIHLENLRKATQDRKLEHLDSAIESAKTSCVAHHLIDTKEMANAETTRRQLKRLKLYMHKVLELNKPTISEIHSYQRPKPLIHTVMQATFRLLGEPNKKLQNWSYIQNLMRRLGRDSMIRRMRRADVVNLKRPQVNAAGRYLSKTNKVLVRMCSAGAGTFYVWSNNMISEYQGKGITEPQNIWGKSGRDDPYAPRKQWENGGRNSSRRNNNNSPTKNSYDRNRGMHSRRDYDEKRLDESEDNTLRTVSNTNRMDYESAYTTPREPERQPSPERIGYGHDEAHQEIRTTPAEDGWDPNRPPPLDNRRRASDEWDPNVPPSRK